MPAVRWNQRTRPAGAPRGAVSSGRRHADRPAGFGPYRASRVGVGVAPSAGAGSHHGEPATALGHQVEGARRGDRRAAFVGDRDPGHAITREIDLNGEHAAVPRGGVRDRVRAELGHAGHEGFSGRAADQDLSHEPACLRHGRGRAAKSTNPGSRRSDRTEGIHVKHRVGTAHLRSPLDKLTSTLGDAPVPAMVHVQLLTIRDGRHRSAGAGRGRRGTAANDRTESARPPLPREGAVEG
jgi:hypothetical protein